GRRRRRGASLSRRGHRRRRRDRGGRSLRPYAQVASRVTTRRTACGGAASRSRRGRKLGAATRKWLAGWPVVPGTARRRACRPGLVTASTVVAPVLTALRPGLAVSLVIFS